MREPSGWCHWVGDDECRCRKHSRNEPVVAGPPRSWAEENIPRLQTFWTGDIWKVSHELNKSHGIEFNVIVADNGVGVIKKISSETNYKENYSELKNLKYKDFIDRLEKINYITPEEFFSNLNDN